MHHTVGGGLLQLPWSRRNFLRIYQCKLLNLNVKGTDKKLVTFAEKKLLCINWHKYTKQRIAHNHGCYLRFNISWLVCVAVRKFVGFKVVSVLRDRNPRFQSGPAPSPSSPCNPHGWLSHPCHEMFANYSQTRLLIWETILMTRVLFGAPPWVMWGFWIRKLFGAPCE